MVNTGSTSKLWKKLPQPAGFDDKKLSDGMYIQMYHKKHK